MPARSSQARARLSGAGLGGEICEMRMISPRRGSSQRCEVKTVCHSSEYPQRPRGSPGLPPAGFFFSYITRRGGPAGGGGGGGGGEMGGGGAPGAEQVIGVPAKRDADGGSGERADVVVDDGVVTGEVVDDGGDVAQADILERGEQLAAEGHGEETAEAAGEAEEQIAALVGHIGDADGGVREEVVGDLAEGEAADVGEAIAEPAEGALGGGEDGSLKDLQRPPPGAG